MGKRGAEPRARLVNTHPRLDDLLEPVVEDDQLDQDDGPHRAAGDHQDRLGGRRKSRDVHDPHRGEHDQRMHDEARQQREIDPIEATAQCHPA